MVPTTRFGPPQSVTITSTRTTPAPTEKRVPIVPGPSHTKWLPTIVTVVPPTDGPWSGLTRRTTGAWTNENNGPATRLSPVCTTTGHDPASWASVNPRMTVSLS